MQGRILMMSVGLDKGARIMKILAGSGCQCTVVAQGMVASIYVHESQYDEAAELLTDIQIERGRETRWRLHAVMSAEEANRAMRNRLLPEAATEDAGEGRLALYVNAAEPPELVQDAISPG